MNERLTKTARGHLLSSVLIRDAGTTGVGPNIERDKLNFLYDRRNAFTHRAEAEGQYTRAIAPYLATLEGDAVAMSYSWVRNEGTVDHSVQAWPFVLYEIVADYIGEAVPSVRRRRSDRRTLLAVDNFLPPSAALTTGPARPRTSYAETSATIGAFAAWTAASSVAA